MVSNSESYNVRVFQPKIVSGIKVPLEHKPNVTGVNGYVELSRHYYDGTHIIMEGYVYAYNGTNEPCSADAWFRHTRMDAAGFNVEIPAPSKSGEDFDTGDSYGPYSSNSMLDFPIGAPMDEGDSYRMNAHIHLVVGNNVTTDVWHDNEWTHTFNYNDNCNDNP